MRLRCCFCTTVVVLLPSAFGVKAKVDEVHAKIMHSSVDGMSAEHNKRRETVCWLNSVCRVKTKTRECANSCEYNGAAKHARVAPPSIAHKSCRRSHFFEQSSEYSPSSRHDVYHKVTACLDQSTSTISV